MYHGVVREPLPVPDWCFVSEDQFAAEMQYLAKETRVLPLETALQRLRSGRLREPTVAITFDDGFQSVHDLAFPILRDLSLPATVFLATSFVDSRRTVWFCELLQILSLTAADELEWRGQRYDLRDSSARSATSARLQAFLKEMHPDEISVALRDIAENLGVDSDAAAATQAPFQMLDGASITSMVRSGLIEFGAHTETHTILTRVAPERAKAEIHRSIDRTAELVGSPCRSFAYPNGRTQDYDEVALVALRDAGIRNAVTSIQGPNTGDTPLLELRRYGAAPGASLGRFQCEVHHLRSRLLRSR